MEEEDTATGTWVAHGGGEVTVAQDTTTTLNPGQFLYDVTIQSNDASLDPGTGFTGMTKKYKLTANTSGGLNPKEFFLDITYRNECRDLVVSA